MSNLFGFQLTTSIYYADIALKANIDDVYYRSLLYTQTEINNILSATLNSTDIPNYHTKTQTNGLLTNYYDKTQVEALVHAPQNIVYTCALHFQDVPNLGLNILKIKGGNNISIADSSRNELMNMSQTIIKNYSSLSIFK
jgi:hypothetical protein